MTRSLPWLVACAACALAAFEAGRSPFAEARAQELDASARLCHAFQQPLESGPALDTTDRTSEVGRWVAEQAAHGWHLHDLDWEVASKASGYPQAYVHVCLAR